MKTTPTRAARRSALGASIALILAMFMFAAPAQAAVAVDLTTTTPTVAVGETITLNWTSTEAVTLVAGGAWSDDKTAPSGTQDIVASAAGPQIFTLLATDVNGREATGSVTVQVTPPTNTDVTPTPVTFPDACTVVVPATTGVLYSVTLDGDTFEIDPDSYDGLEFFSEDGEPAVFTAAADSDHVLDPDATAEWTYTPSDDCLEDFGSDRLVTTTTACSSVTFANVSGLSVDVFYGDFDNDEADGDFTLAAGASKTIQTPRADLTFIGFDEDEELLQIDTVTVSQDCGAEVSDPKPGKSWPAKVKKHPTSAPAAGVDAEGTGSPAPVLAILGVLALVAARRAHASLD